MSEEKGIWIITSDEGEKGGKGGTDTGYDYGRPAPENQLISRKVTRIKAADLKRNMSEFLEVVEETFEKAEKPSSKIQLEELELAVEINGKGQVSLLGTGGEAGAKGAITLKFKRKDG